MIEQKIKCDVCGLELVEKEFGSGFNGWGQLKGIILNGSENPHLCPEHLGMVANFIDSMAE